MAKLDITVRGLDKLTAATRGLSPGGGTSTVDLQRTEQLLQRQSRLVAIMARGAKEFGTEMLRGVQSVDAKLAALSRKSIGTRISDEERLKREREKNEATYWRGVERWNRRMLQARLAGEREYARERERLDAAAARAALARRQAILGGLGGLAGGAGGLLGGAGRVIGSAGTQLGGVIGGLGSGGIGGLARSAGSLGAVGLQGAANLGGSILGKIPIAGGLLQGGAQALGGVAGGVAQLAGNLGGQVVDSVLTTVKVGLAAGLGIAVAAAVRAAKVEPVAEAFKGLSKSIGEDGTEALEKYRAAARGTVDDLTLMRQANLAVQLGAVDSAKDFELLIGASRRLGKAVGRDASEALNDLTVGLSRQSNRILDNLGIIVSAETAYQKFAASIGTTADALDDSQRKSAFNAAAIEAIEKKLAAAGDETLTFGDRFNRLQASALNFLDKAGRPILDVLSDMAEPLTRIVNRFTTWLSENRVTIAAKLATATENIGTALAKAAEYLEGNSLADVLESAKNKAEELFEVVARKGIRAFGILKGEVLAFALDAQRALSAIASGGLTEFIGESDPRTGARVSSRAAASTSHAKSAARTRALLESDQIAADLFGSRGGGFGGGPASPGAGGGYFPYAQNFARGSLLQIGARGFSALTGGGRGGAVAPESPGLTLRPDFLAGARRLGVGAGDAEAIFPKGELAKLSREESIQILERIGELEKQVAQEKRATAILKPRESVIDGKTKTAERLAESIEESYRKIAETEDRRLEISRNILAVDKEMERVGLERVSGFLRAADQIGEAARQQIAGLTATFRGGLEGGLGGREIPSNLRRGAARREGLEARGIKNQLRQEFGHLSAGEIARLPAEDFARIEGRAEELRIGAARPLRRARDRVAEEVGPRAFGPEVKEIEGKASADLEKALATITKESETAKAALAEERDAFLKQQEALTEVITAVRESAAEKEKKLRDVSDELKTLKRELDNVTKLLGTRG